MYVTLSFLLIVIIAGVLGVLFVASALGGVMAASSPKAMGYHNQVDVDSEMYFMHLDLDADDVLSTEEISGQFIDALAVKGRNTADIMNDMDRNRDGQVTFEEFLGFTSPIMEAHHAEADFMTADKDHDGSLSLLEYRNSGHADSANDQLQSNHISNKIKEQYKSIDANGDHKVTKEEYVAIQGKDPFSQMDTDHDNKVTLEEWAVHWSDSHQAPESATFKIMDLNKDDYLSRSEHKKLGDLYHEESLEDVYDGTLGKQEL